MNQRNSEKAQLSLRLGVQAFEDQNLEEALQHFRQALDLDGTLAEAAYYQGQILLELGDSAEAIALLTHAIGVEPDFYDAYVNRGVVWNTIESDPNKALSDFNRAIALNPDRPEAYWNKAISCLNASRLGEALDCLNWLISDRPFVPNYYQLRACVRIQEKDYGAALADLSRAIELSPQEATCYYNRAETHRATGETALAIADYSAAIQHATDEMVELRAGAHLAKGLLLTADEDYISAFYEFDRGVLVDPQNHLLLHHRGKALMRLGQISAALESLEAAVETDPYCLEGIYDRMIARFLTQDFLGALGDIHILEEHDLSTEKINYYKACSILEVGPDCSVGLELLRSLQDRLKEDPEQSLLLKQVNAVLKVADSPDILDARSPEQIKAEVEFTCGDKNAFLESVFCEPDVRLKLETSYRWALERKDHTSVSQALIEFDAEKGWICPEWVRGLLTLAIANGYNSLGIMHAKEGRLHTALDCFNRGLVLMPEDPSLLMNRGRTYLEIDQPNRALPDFHKACEVNPCPEYLRRKADVLFRLGDMHGAIAGYQEVLSLDPEYTICQEKLDSLLGLSKRQLQALSLSQKAESVAIDDSCVGWNEVVKLLTQAFNYETDFPGAGEAYYLLGITQAKLHQFEEAKGSIERALEHAPNDHRILICLGQILGQLKEPQQAISYLVSAQTIARRAKDKEAMQFIRQLLTIFRSTPLSPSPG